MFDGKNSKKIDFLDNERLKTWKRIEALEKEVAEKPSDLEKEARQASRKAAEFRNKTEERLNQAVEIEQKILNIEGTIKAKSDSINNINNEISEIKRNTLEKSNTVIKRGDELANLLNSITAILDEHPELESEAQSLDNLISEIQENSSKANTTYKGILAKKQEVDELHREIIGYDDENEEGVTIKVEGIKTKLESSYNNLNDNAKKLSSQISNLDKESRLQYDSFINTNQSDLNKTKEEAKLEYKKINDRISSLLPDALTAGLSSAFIAKKKEEETLFSEYKASFKKGITNLSLVATLPIAISVFFLYGGASLIEVVERAPKIILAFMPLYIPLIWTTISSNKKVNLSKRLIEEYSHKQVLSMTIEGLSNQIENIEDNDISEELRIQLLHNFLSVTKENPGKLISDYQKSDNPFFNLLDRQKSNKKSIVNTMEEKAKEIIETAGEEVVENITKSN